MIFKQHPGTSYQLKPELESCCGDTRLTQLIRIYTEKLWNYDYLETGYPTFQFLVEMRTHKKSAVHMLLYHENFDSRSSGILNIDPLQTTGPGLADKIQNFNNLYFRNWVSNYSVPGT
ncbi:hypothetical protein ACHWQZ_G015782 [Mnemiopsis leidyi]